MLPRTTLALFVALLTALALAGWQWGRAEGFRADLEKAKSTFADERTELAQAQTIAVTKARAEEAATARKIKDALDAEHRARVALEDDLRHADAVAVSLRQRTSELAVAARCPAANPATTASSSAANSAADLLAVMSGRLDEAAGAIALYAAKASIAGQLCERSYDALGPPQE